MARLAEFFDMADDGDNAPPRLSEPSLVATMMVSGCEAKADGVNVRLTFWDSVPMGEDGREHRVAVRLALPRQAAHGLMAQLQAIFAGEH